MWATGVNLYVVCINALDPDPKLTDKYVYWLLSCFATDVTSNARNGGIFRFWEAVGQAISYGVSSRKELGNTPLYGVLVVIAFQLPFTWLVIRTVPLYRTDDIRKPVDVENADKVLTGDQSYEMADAPEDGDEDKDVKAAGVTTVVETR